MGRKYVDIVDVLDTYTYLYDVFGDNKAVQKELRKVYDRLCGLYADVRENVRGEWRKVADKAEHITYECVICGAKVHVARNVVTPNFCSRCGADMRGEE